MKISLYLAWLTCTCKKETTKNWHQLSRYSFSKIFLLSSSNGSSLHSLSLSFFWRITVDHFKLQTTDFFCGYTCFGVRDLNVGHGLPLAIFRRVRTTPYHAFSVHSIASVQSINLFFLAASKARPRCSTGGASTSESNFSDPGIPDSSTTTEASFASSRRPRTGPTSSPTSTSCGIGRPYGTRGRVSTGASRPSFRSRALRSRSTRSSTPFCSAPKDWTKTRAVVRARREIQIQMQMRIRISANWVKSVESQSSFFPTRKNSSYRYFCQVWLSTCLARFISCPIFFNSLQLLFVWYRKLEDENDDWRVWKKILFSLTRNIFFHCENLILGSGRARAFLRHQNDEKVARFFLVAEASFEIERCWRFGSRRWDWTRGRSWTPSSFFLWKFFFWTFRKKKHQRRHFQSLIFIPVIEMAIRNQIPLLSAL